MLKPVLLLCLGSAVVFSNGCGGGSSGGPPPPPVVSVSISPTSATVPTGGTQQFSATVTGTTNTAVTWSVNGAGMISTSGLYTAPATVPSTSPTVTATSQADTTKSASASVTVTKPPPPIQARDVSVSTGGTTSGINIALQAMTPTLSLTAAGLNGSAGGTGAQVSRGQSTTLLLVGNGIVVGTSYAVSGPGDVTVVQPSPSDFTTTTDGMPAVNLSITVSSSATPGPRDILVTNGNGEIAVMVGGLSIQ